MFEKAIKMPFINGFILAGMLLTFSPLNAEAKIKITVGKPDNNGGMVQWEVTDNNETKKIIKINVPNNTTPEGKARLLENELGKQGLNVERNGAMVTINNAKKAEKFQDETNEEDKITTVAAKPKVGLIDFHLNPNTTVLAGLDENGFESVFQASIGFDGIIADANFNFSDLSSNTIDALLTDTFADLLLDIPVIYQYNLSLDLNNDLIQFIFPDNVSEGFVENVTSDINAFSSLSLDTEPIPEPTSTLSLLAFGTLSAGSVLKRKQKKDSN